MAMPPAYEEWEITHSDHAARLRPSLRAAIRLERLHDGFTGLHQHVGEFHLGTVTDIIMTAATDRKDARAFLNAVENLPLALVQVITMPAIMQLLAALVPAADPHAKPATSSKPMSWPVFYGQLFDYGTGWLGWNPESTWNATPNEILAAFEAHVEKLNRLNGTSPEAKAADPDQAERNIAEGLDPEFDRAGFHALKARIAAGM